MVDSLNERELTIGMHNFVSFLFKLTLTPINWQNYHYKNSVKTKSR